MRSRKVTRSDVTDDLKPRPAVVFLLTVSGTLAVLAGFLLDVMLPHGWSPWLLYLPLCAVLWAFHSERVGLAGTVLCSGLIVAGLYASWPSAAKEVALFDRTAGLAALWSVFLVGRANKRMLTKIGVALEQRVCERTAGLAENQQRLQAVLDTTVEGIVTIQEHGRVESMNNSAQRMFGYSAEEVIGRNVSMLMPSPYREQHDDYIVRYLETGQAKIIGVGREVAGRRKDGTIFPLDVGVSEVKLGDRRFFTGVLRDLTQRKQAEESLRQERDFNSAVLQTTAALIVVLDESGRVIRFNQACEQATGYLADEIEGKPFWDLLLPPDELAGVQTVFDQLRSGQFPNNHENCWLTKAGQRRFISWSNTVLTEPDGSVKHIIGAGLDVTERKRLEAEVAYAAEQERGRIARDLHDGLGQELGAALFLSDLLLRDLKERDATEAPQAGKVHHLIEQALADVRTISRGLHPVPPESDGLMTALQNLADRVKGECGIDCRFDADSAVLLEGAATATHLYRLAQEAVNNALKHSGTRRIDVRLDATANQLELVVRDYGKGLPETGNIRTGLGLQTMRHRAQMLGGRLTVENAPGGGARVRCVAPHYRAKSAAVPASAAISSI